MPITDIIKRPHKYLIFRRCESHIWVNQSSAGESDGGPWYHPNMMNQIHIVNIRYVNHSLYLPPILNTLHN